MNENITTQSVRCSRAQGKCISFCQGHLWQLSGLFEQLDTVVLGHMGEIEDTLFPEDAIDGIRDRHERAFEAAKASILLATKSIQAMRNVIINHGNESSTDVGDESRAEGNAGVGSSATIAGGADVGGADVGGADVGSDEGDGDGQDGEGGIRIT